MSAHMHLVVDEDMNFQGTKPGHSVNKGTLTCFFQFCIMSFFGIFFMLVFIGSFVFVDQTL